MAMAAVGVASTLSSSAAGSLFAPIARAAGRIGDSASEMQREAAEALAAAGSASGSVASVVNVGAGVATAFALLLAIGTTTGFGSADLGDGGVLLGLVVGASIPLFAGGAIAGTSHRSEERGMWTEVLRLVVPVSVATAIPVALGIGDVGVLRGFVTGAVGAGLGVAGFVVIAGERGTTLVASSRPVPTVGRGHERTVPWSPPTRSANHCGKSPAPPSSHCSQ